MKKVFEFIERQKDKRFLVAVSGGIDSMVLANIFLKSNAKFALVHCNFGLRGSQSDLDEELVRQTAEKMNVEFKVRRFETASYSKKHKISIQMAARKLRYDWFDSIMESEKFDLLATAHHACDNFETVLLNLTKGTSIEGLTGMQPIKGNRFRPLLACSKSEIEVYAHQNQIVWREDASNKQTYYQRNHLRIKVIPALEKINPSLFQTSVSTLEKIAAANDILKESLLASQTRWLKEQNQIYYVDLETLKRESHPAYRIYELLKNFGFNFEQCKSMLDSQQSGKRYDSSSHEVLFDRGWLIVSSKVEQGSPSFDFFSLNQFEQFVLQDFAFEITQAAPSVFQSDEWLLDAGKFEFPLQLRLWQKGDYFVPLGMKQRKKVSDFLIDRKINLKEKQRTYVLSSGNSIALILGMSISELFKITNSSKTILKIKKI